LVTGLIANALGQTPTISSVVEFVLPSITVTMPGVPYESTGEGTQFVTWILLVTSLTAIATGFVPTGIVSITVCAATKPGDRSNGPTASNEPRRTLRHQSAVFMTTSLR